jgi:hypothetical protein
MKVTTLRFGEDLWTLLEQEAALAGVSVSQYVREAALARAAAAAGARGESPYDGLARSARELASFPRGNLAHRHEVQRAVAALARALAGDQRDSADALKGESAQRKKRAAELVEQAAAKQQA